MIQQFRPLKIFFLAMLVMALTQRCRAAADDLVQYVNTLQGTDSTYALSRGNTLPLVGAPWGMTDWCPQTVGGSIFEYRRTQISGIRATHQPSPWMGDYGQFVLMPQTGGLVLDAKDRGSNYNVDAGIFRPDYCRVNFDRYDVAAEVTATERCGVLRFTFAKGESGRIIFDAAAQSHIEIDGRTIRGYSKANSGNVPKNFACYFVAVLDRDITARSVGDGIGYVEFKTAAEKKVQISVGTSFVSLEQAGRNLVHETVGGFDAVRDRMNGIWQKQLSRIQIEGGSDEAQNFLHLPVSRTNVSASNARD